MLLKTALISNQKVLADHSEKISDTENPIKDKLVLCYRRCENGC